MIRKPLAGLFAALILGGAWATRLSAQPAPTTGTATAAPSAADKESAAMAKAPDTPLNEEPENAPRARRPDPGKVLETAADGRGGATSFTIDMPLDEPGLIEMRKPFIGRPEFRGAWVTRMDWIVKTEGKVDAKGTREKIVTIMENARKVGLNAVLFQVRGDATTLYPSTMEPWSQRFNGTDPGFDPVKFAIGEAHKRGLEFHAYFNPVPCSEERTTTPAHKDHVFYKHCMPDSVPNWLVYQDGKPAPFNEYKWLNPNLPEVQTYIRTVVLDFVKRYDIDGIHYDRIRFPSHKVSDDPWSKARFEAGTNPDKLTYNQWQGDNITRMLTDIYGAIMEIKPKVKTTAAVWGIYDNTKLPQGRDKRIGYTWTSSGLQNYMQDSIGWVNRGCMDALVPMIYWSMGDLKPDFDELLLTFVAGIKNGRHVYGGQSVFSTTEMLREVVAANRIGAQGTVPFTLGRIARPEMMEYYRKNIYPEPAAVPDMPWKTKPKTGAVLVTVKDSSGKPVVDAHVRVSGRKDVALSSADGFCATLGVEPGAAKIEVEKAGVGKAETEAKVSVGKATRIAVTLK
ncbi:MAG: family 10 glycosylhydrolase [Candidatus Sumerlaeaceae bacterium]|nr:family 10 glycosylhydrolase [Candidatus Sumerlaeaceae bacterium]